MSDKVSKAQQRAVQWKVAAKAAHSRGKTSPTLLERTKDGKEDTGIKTGYSIKELLEK